MLTCAGLQAYISIRANFNLLYSRLETSMKQFNLKDKTIMNIKTICKGMRKEF